MPEAPVTRPSLLVRLRDPRDDAAWSQFVDLYAPLVYGFARKRGLQDADAADFTQEVLRAVSGAIGRLDYDPRRGSFRGWLFTAVRHRLRDFLRARRGGAVNGQEWLDELPDNDPGLAAQWEQEYERRLFAWAAEQVRATVHDSTWQAFWKTAVEGRGGQEVARELGLSVAAVYLAKGRVMSRLKELIAELQES